MKLLYYVLLLCALPIGVRGDDWIEPEVIEVRAVVTSERPVDHSDTTRWRVLRVDTMPRVVDHKYLPRFDTTWQERIEPDTAAYRELCKGKCFCGWFHQRPECPRGYHIIQGWTIDTYPEMQSYDCECDNLVKPEPDTTALIWRIDDDTIRPDSTCQHGRGR